MATILPVINHIKRVIDSINTVSELPKRVLSLGYPDILASKQDLANIFGESIVAGLPVRADSEQVIRWHGANDRLSHIVESVAFFSALGLELDVADIAIIRGGERIIDLNQPCPTDMQERYALVIDGGTCEHCFNIAQAVRNVAEMTAVGGYVIAINPMSMFNHGFYNLNPTWYHDFYSTNGFSIHSLQLTVLGRPDILLEIPAYQRLQKVPDNSMLLMLARRTSNARIIWPTQMKYRKTPDLKG